MPLTADRAKPAVPFAGIYRLIDFALSNLVNSGYLKIVVLTQYKSHSLDPHVTKTWRMSTLLGNYVHAVPAQQRVGKNWYLGSADAIYQSLNLIHDERPDIVVVVGADHVYRMDFARWSSSTSSRAGVHGRRDPPADLARRPVRRHRGRRRRPAQDRPFLEKPTDAKGLPDTPDEVLASMGNYVFNADALVEAVTRDHDPRAASTTWAATSCPTSSTSGEAASTTSRTTTCPAPRPRPRLLARRRHDRLLLRRPHGPHLDPPGLQPLQLRVADLHDHGPSRRRSSSTAAATASARRSTRRSPPGASCRGRTSTPRCSLRSSRCTPTPASWQVLLDGGRGGPARQIRRAIIDKNVVVPEGCQIGIDHEHDRARGFHVTETGIIVVGKGQVLKP